MEEKKKEIKFTLAKIILGLIILILILLFVRSCAKIGIYLELEEKKYYVYHSTTFPLPKAKAYDNKGKKLNIEITIYKNGKEKEGIDTNHIGDKYVVYYKTYKRNMYLKKQIEVEIIRNPNLLGYTIEGISNIWTKEDVILTFVPKENNIVKYCVKGTCTTNKEFTIEKNETFETYIIDEYGNKSLKNEYEVTNIDKESPIIKEVNEYNNKGKRYIGVKGEDTLSGVAEYSYDGGKTYSTASTKEVSSGQIITIKIKDLVGNESEEYKYTVGNKTEEDTESPTFTITRNPEANSRGWNNTNVTLTIKAEDDISGIAGYSFDNGNTWQTEHIKEYTSTTTVKIKVKDNAGNISESKSVEVKIDKISPKIKAKKESETEYKEIVTGTTYDEKIEIEIEEENIYEIELTYINQEKEKIETKYTEIEDFPKEIEEKGSYNIKIIDKAGNISEVIFLIASEIKITGLVEDKNYYNESVTPTVEGKPVKEKTILKKDNEIITYEIGDTITEDGKYDLYVENEYGRYDEETFTIDKASPELISEEEGKIEAEDENLETIIIFEDEIPIICLAPEEGEVEGVNCEEAEYEIKNGKRTIEYSFIPNYLKIYKVKVIDKAGNITEKEYKYCTWETSSSLNTTGGYTLEGINGDIQTCIIKGVETEKNYYTETNVSKNYYDMSGYKKYSAIPNKDAYTINIPNEVNGKTITELGSELFQAMDAFYGYIINEPYMRIISATIPEGIVKINGIIDYGEEILYTGTFTSNFNLTEITLPSTLTDIGILAFDFNNLTGSLTIPSSVTTIGENAFTGNKIETLTFTGTSQLTTIGDGAFNYNNLTGSLTIPSSVETIGNFAFSSNKITSLTIPSSVTTIGNSAFSDNEITSAVIPDFMTKIPIGIYSKNKITTLNIPSFVTEIGGYAFGENEIETLIIPSSVETIGNYAFKTNNLTTLTIPSSVTTIGNSAFESNNLTTLTIPSSVTTIGNRVFYSNNLTGSLTIPSSVTTIGPYAFSSYLEDLTPNQLTAVTIPSSVTTIGENAFTGNKIETLTFTGTSQLTTIGDGAFTRNKITSLTIPSSVTTIGSYAFSYNEITSAVIPDFMTKIPSGIYSKNKITTLNIPSFVTEIGGNAFEDNEIETLTFEENSQLTTIGAGAFEMNNLTTLTIPSSVTTIKWGAFRDNEITSAVIPDFMTNIPNYIYSGNKITTLNIPSFVKTIGDSAFSGNNLITLTFEENSQLTTIRTGAFEMNNLTTLTIPSSVKNIGNLAFYSNNLTGSLTIPSSVTTIGSYAFSSYFEDLTPNQLTSLIIPSSVTTIGEGAFESNNLTTLTIPSSVTTIGDYIFNSNPNLETITVKRADLTGVTHGDNWNCKTKDNNYCSLYYTINWDPS